MPEENTENANPDVETPQDIDVESADMAAAMSGKVDADLGLKDFWSEVVDVWQHGFMGIDIGKILAALAIFSVFLLLRGVLTRYILSYIRKWSSTSKTDIDDKIIDALIPPIRFIPIILGVFFAAQALQLEGILAIFIARIVRSMIAYTIFWAFVRALTPIRRMSKRMEKILTATMMDWMFKFIKVVVMFIGAAVILEIWGIAIGPLLAGLGLFGAAVALGAQDLFKNLIGGLTVIIEKRFNIGDWIKVEGVVEGVVEEIGFRSTKVRRFDKAPVHVPNSDLSDAVVTNFSRMTNRRIYWMIGVEYRATKDQLRLIRQEIEDYISNNDDFEKPPKVATFVRIDSFNDSSIDIMIYCFTKTTDWGEWLKIKEEFALAIKEIVEDKAGAGFAFPSQSIYVETLPDGSAPESFVPPSDKAA